MNNQCSKLGSSMAIGSMRRKMYASSIYCRGKRKTRTLGKYSANYSAYGEILRGVKQKHTQQHEGVGRIAQIIAYSDKLLLFVSQVWLHFQAHYASFLSNRVQITNYSRQQLSIAPHVRGKCSLRVVRCRAGWIQVGCIGARHQLSQSSHLPKPLSELNPHLLLPVHGAFSTRLENPLGYFVWAIGELSHLPQPNDHCSPVIPSR